MYSHYIAAAFASSIVLSYAKICTKITVPLNITARSAIFDIPALVSNSDATAFVQNLTRQGENFTEVALTSYQTISKAYNIATELCTPSEAVAKTPTVQILTHGLGFDRSYWDLPFNNFNYSYTAVATDEYKYCTLSYDRLGLGQSSHGDPIDEIQASVEVAVLAELTVMLREGKYPGAKQPFEKVVHIGHSFGSALTYALVSAMPTLSDGVVLTGFSLNSSSIPLFIVASNFVQANLNQPFRFGNITDPQIQAISAKLNEPINAINDKSLQAILAEYDLVDYVAGLDPRQRVEYAAGYLTNSNANANQYNFLLPGKYDPEIATFAEENKQPITPGELLTLGSAPRSSDFKGPVLVLTGSNDLPFCGGNCASTGNASIPSIPATVKAAFPKLDKADFVAYLQPETGHGINLHYNATGAYGVINHFLQAKGLQSQLTSFYEIANLDTSSRNLSLRPKLAAPVKNPRSKGCRVCVARRVKCDQTRPACQRCIRAHRICSGFDRIEFVDEGPQLRSLYDAPAPETPAFTPGAFSGTFSTSPVSEPGLRSGSREIAASRDASETSQPVNEAGRWIQGAFERGALVTLLAPNVMQDQLLANFIASLREPVLASTFRSHNSWLTEVALRPSLSDSLTWAVRAISISNLGRKAEDPELIEVSRFLYGKSLLKLKRTLEDKDEGLSSDTLSATILLSFYEVFNCTNDYAWIRHAGGAGRLIQLRGPDRHRSGFGRTVFLACRTSVIMDAFQQHIPCFLEAPPWRKLCWDLHQDKSPAPLIFTDEEYFQELVKYPAFLREVNQAIGNPNTKVESFSRLHTKGLTNRSNFHSIHDRMGQEMLAAGTGPTNKPSSLQDSPFPVVYTYPDIHIATHYCCYWTIMCAMNIAVLGLEAKIASIQAVQPQPPPREAQGLPVPAPVPSNHGTQASPSPERSDPHPRIISPFWAAAKSRGNAPTYVAENAGYAREICKSVEFMYRTPFLGPLFLVVALRMALRMFISEEEKAWIVRMLKDIGKRMGFATVEVERYKAQRSKTVRAEWGSEGSPGHKGLVDGELER